MNRLYNNKRGVGIAAKCTGAKFSITGEDVAEYFEGVDSFKYLGRIQHRMDEYWPEVLCNIRRVRQVWGAVMEVAE